MFMKLELNKGSKSLTFPRCLMLNMGFWGATTTFGGRDYDRTIYQQIEV